MHVVDASVWISRFVPTDGHYQSRHEWLGNQVSFNDVVVSPTILLAEVGSAIARQTRNSEMRMIVVGLMQRFPNVRLVPIDASLAALSAQLAVNPPTTRRRLLVHSNGSSPVCLINNLGP